jgi:phenylalanyl-tRNA synthetase beta subunit
MKIQAERIAFKPTEETLTNGEAAKLQKRQIKRMHE